MASTPPLPKERTLAYCPGIDGMRAVAVLGVVLYHAGFGPPAGFVGVDVFFVISGFLITSLLEAELTATGRVDLAAFYARRVRRLFPALGIVLAVTVAASVAVLSYGELTSALQSAAASVVFGANVFFQYTTGDYFGPNVNHLPLLHLWSLGVEEQYYLLWPVALLLGRRRPLGARRVIFAAFALTSLAFGEWALYRGSQAAFYAMPSRWWELSLGAHVAWAPASGQRHGRWESWVGLLVVAVAMALPTRHFPGVGALPATIGAALLLHASTAKGGAWRVLSSQPMVLIGRVSYPFYLWHWPLLVFASAAIPFEVSAPTRAALVLMALLLATATWQWLERPLHVKPLAQPSRLVCATVVTCIAMALLIFQVADATGHAPPPPDDPGAVAESDAPANMLRCNNLSIRPSKLPDEADCVVGGNAPPRVAIWGDSHALAMQPFALAVAIREGKTAIDYSRFGCAPAIGYDNGESPLAVARCRDFNAAVLRRAETMDTVILASRWPAPDVRDFATDLSATVDQLSFHVRRIYIIGATPVLPASVPDCLRRKSLSSCEAPRDEFLARTAAIRTLLLSIAARHPNVTYVEPLDFFCDQKVCPGARQGMPLYWDNNHVSSTAAAAFAHSYLRGKTQGDL
jgi:peptidoglycan/LPS O-acetylase OafA/YrhL